MKKLALLILIPILLSINKTFAGSAEVFNYDNNKITSELATLDELTQLLEQNRVTYSELVHYNNQLTSELKYYNTGAFGIQSLDNVLGIKSFYWGCCLGGIGVGIVFLATGDLKETTKSFYGCLISTILWGGGLLLR